MQKCEAVAGNHCLMEGNDIHDFPYHNEIIAVIILYKLNIITTAVLQANQDCVF